MISEILYFTLPLSLALILGVLSFADLIVYGRLRTASWCWHTFRWLVLRRPRRTLQDNICVACQWHRHADGGWGQEHSCTQPRVLNQFHPVSSVTGTREYNAVRCGQARQGDSPCGPYGDLWESEEEEQAENGDD